MKPFRAIREQKESLRPRRSTLTPVDESLAFTDPPNVLVLRRKAIRLFPNNQRVVTYRNDNLHLDVAIPYNPVTLGKQRIDTIGTTSESLEESTSDNLFGMYLKHASAPTQLHDRTFKPMKRIEDVVRQRYGEPALRHFKAAAAHHTAGDMDRANHHFEKFKRHADQLGEDTMAGGTCSTCSGTGVHDSAACPTCHGEGSSAKLKTWDDMRKLHHSVGPKDWAISKPMKAVLTGEAVMEATIHSLHQINKMKTPAQVKFGNGSSAMVHHEVAARIMALHSKMKPANKRKIERLVNASPDGLKKVIEFATVHMK